MGSKPSSAIDEHGYTVNGKTEGGVVVVSKEGETRMIKTCELSTIECDKVESEIKTLLAVNHLNIVKCRETFQDEKHLYVVMDHCQGDYLADKIKQKRESGLKFEEDQILDWIVQICMGLKYLHKGGLIHQNLVPKNLILTEFGTVRLANPVKVFPRLHGKSMSSVEQELCFSSPEMLTREIYDSKSDIWAMGCLLYELCTLESAFTAQNIVRLIPKVVKGPYPSLPEDFTPELCQLLKDIFQKRRALRPAASEILGRPFIITFLSRKVKSTIEKLPECLVKLGILADSLENMHRGATIGSLTGGVFGAAGGITSIVGLILAPITLGASLVVTGVGIGVAVAGGATSGISNITNMVNQSSDRQAIRGIIQQFDESITFVVTALQEVNEGLEMLNEHIHSNKSEEVSDNPDKKHKLLANLGRGVSGIPELLRLIQAVNLGKIAAQTAKILRVAEVATGILAAFFLALDVFFIAMDAKEIHHIREAEAEVEAENMTRKRSTNRLELMDNPEGDRVSQADEKKETIKSDTMKFVYQIRQTITHLQDVVNDLNEIAALIP